MLDINSKIAHFPLLLSRVSAGFPSPADDFADHPLNINELIIKHPASTYFIRVSGDSMIGAGLFPGDIVVVDRSIKPTHNKVVVAMLDGDFTIKRLKARGGSLSLVADNPKYPPIFIKEQAFEVWGVVTFSVHQVD